MKKEDLKYMKMADDVAQNSLDRSSKVGAVILTKENEVIVGWNTLPIGCSEDDERFISPAKYDWTLHAEQSVICACSKSNKSSLDATMYIN
jgi:deoxycytidylate deaminase